MELGKQPFHVVAVRQLRFHRFPLNRLGLSPVHQFFQVVLKAGQDVDATSVVPSLNTSNKSPIKTGW
jgi:hypothetical protein